jgi:hypothetical protein
MQLATSQSHCRINPHCWLRALPCNWIREVIWEPFDKQLVLRLNILGLLDLQDPSATYLMLLALLLTFSTSGMNDACRAEPAETGIRSVKSRISIGQFRDAYLSCSHSFSSIQISPCVLFWPVAPSVGLTLLLRPGNILARWPWIHAF